MFATGQVIVDRLAQLSDGRHAEYLYQLSDGERAAEVKVARKRRKTLGLQVDRETTELRVPTNCPWDEIHTFLAKNFEWILSAQEEMASRPEVPRDDFRPGGHVSYLGQRLKLDVIKSRYPIVQVEGASLYVSCSNPSNNDLLEKQVMDWMRRQADDLFNERLRTINEQFEDDRQPNGLKVRKMRARWGSCSSSGEVCLNLMLMREALSQIDFVIAHELCHLRHFAHNKSFYRLMDRVMPDWREREQQLKV